MLDHWANWQGHIFSAEDYTNMSYYNLCGTRPKHSNISKKGGGITICVLLDQNGSNVTRYSTNSSSQNSQFENLN